MSDYRDGIDQQFTDIVARTPSHKGNRHMARALLDALVGDDDTPGPLDRYEIRAISGARRALSRW